MSRNQHAYSNPIQQDWDDREFVEVSSLSGRNGILLYPAFSSFDFLIFHKSQIIQLNIIKTANFLNEFDITIRSRISKLNEKLSKLERSVEFCEAVIKSTQDRMKQTENS